MRNATNKIALAGRKELAEQVQIQEGVEQFKLKLIRQNVPVTMVKLLKFAMGG
jgi:hypothetical protein